MGFVFAYDELLRAMRRVKTSVSAVRTPARITSAVYVNRWAFGSGIPRLNYLLGRSLDVENSSKPVRGY